MGRRRTIELTLAGLISIGAAFAALVPMGLAGIADMSAREMIAAAFKSEPAPRPELMRPEARAVLAEFSRPGSMSEPEPFGFAPDGGRAIALSVPVEQVELAFQPRLEISAGDGEARRVLGMSVSASREIEGRRWWIMAGAEHETYAVAPGAEFGQFDLTRIGGSAAVGDAHIGVAFEVEEDVYASLGYVQQRRRFDLGETEWDEEDHFVGATVRMRW